MSRYAGWEHVTPAQLRHLQGGVPPPPPLPQPAGAGVTLILPYFSVNQAWAQVGQRRVRSQAYQDFLRQVGQAVLLTWPRGVTRPLRGPVEVRLVVCPSRLVRTRDLDGPIKPILDALTHAGVWEDDSQVQALAARWGDATEVGHVKAEIWTL